MNRKDYRKLMQIKKRNKNYAKGIVLATLGLGIGLANSTTANAEAREWKANTSTTIKSGDKEYTVKWGDYLELISKGSGLTIETLMKLNDSIVDADLIYEGNVIYFGDSVNAVVKDSQSNIIAETPLTEQDKAGIKEAQSNTATNNTSSSNLNSSSAKTNETATNTNNAKGNNNGGVINTVKPVKPTENGNGGNTTKPTDPTKPIKPVDPVKPQEKEFTITVNHVAENGEVLSKETRKAKENTTVETKALDFTDRGYELIGESTQTINVKEDTTITFKYKKIDDTKPEVKEVDVVIKHVGNDGKVLSTETRKAEKGSTVKADAKDFTAEGYVLNDEISKSVKAENGASIKFNYRKIETPAEEKMLATRTYFNVDTEERFGTDTLEVTLVDGKAIVKADTIPTGFKLAEGETGVREVSKAQSTASFKVVKIDDEKPTEPTNEDKFVTKNLDMSGNDLGQNVDTTKFEEVSRKTDKSVETLDNGNTVTTHTTIIIWKAKDVYVPKHTEETVYVNVDTAGNVLTNTDGYSYIHETSDAGVTTTAENGDTHTIYTTTKVWKKGNSSAVEPSDFGGKYTSNSELIIGESGGTNYMGVGNTGATFPTQRDASLFALNSIADSGRGGTYTTWEVKFKDGTIAYSTSIELK